MGMMELLARRSTRSFGPPPSKDAPKVETWRYVRRIYAWTLFFAIPTSIVIALDDGPIWLWILFGISAVTWLHGFVSVNRRIRTLRSTTPGG